MNSGISCPSHPDAQMVEDHRGGDLICNQCGLVVGERIIDVGNEWRSFGDERSGNDPSRVGVPETAVLSSSSDLSTSIAVAYGGSESDRTLANVERKLMNSSNDRQMNKALILIREMGEKINLARTIQDRAAKRFKEVLESKALRGKSIEAQAAACLYIACREKGVPRKFKEISAVSKVSIKEIGRCFHLITKTLETNLALITSADYMSRFCGNLNLPYPVQMAATRIAQKAVEMDLVAGRNLISIAAAAIFLASQASTEKLTAKEIGEIAGTAGDTIRLTYRLLLPKTNDLFPPEFRFDTSIEELPHS